MKSVLRRIKDAKTKGWSQLDLSHSQLSKLPPEIWQLTNLTCLILNNNYLSKLPPEIGHLTNLTVLILNNNQLTTIPPEIGRLTKLNRLYLRNNRLTTIPPEIVQLTDLTELDLCYNQLINLPPKIFQLINLTRFALYGNRLQKPPIEVIFRGAKAILEYFNALEKSQTKHLYEAKLILVGSGGVGKTTLAKKLIDSNWIINEKELTTEGIEIRNISFPHNSEDFKVNIWDFGGQEIYHATHQFFLTKRSLYLYIWEARREESIFDGFYYWLNIIRLLTDNSPVIVILNKTDERTKEIDQALYKSQFDSIVEFRRISCCNNKGIEELLELVKEEIIKLPHIGIEWPEIWTNIRSKLENDIRDYINFQEYISICKEFGLNETAAGHLSEFLHDLGVILHFQDDQILRNTVILKPTWGTNAVYKVLDTKKIVENKGRFKIKDLDNIWCDKKYPQDKHPELLQLMMRFELCFNLQDTKEYIVPELLSPERPEFVWDYKNNMQFEYRYNFMPAGIITRFIVRQHRRIENNNYWKNGVILNYDDTRALIISDQIQYKITILIDGLHKKEMLSIIRSDFGYIHETLNNLQVDEMVPCNCPNCFISKDPFFFVYNDLINFRYKLKKKTKECGKSGENVLIDKLINDIIISMPVNTRNTGPQGNYYEQYEIAAAKIIDEKPDKNITNNEKYPAESFWATRHPWKFALVTGLISSLVFANVFWEKLRDFIKEFLTYILKLL